MKRERAGRGGRAGCHLSPVAAHIIGSPRRRVAGKGKVRKVMRRDFLVRAEVKEMVEEEGEGG